MSHLREPRVVNVYVLDGMEGAPYRVVSVDNVVVVGAAHMRRVVGVVNRAVVLVEVVVVPMRHPLGEGVTRLTDPVSGKHALAGDDGGRGVGRGRDAKLEVPQAALEFVSRAAFLTHHYPPWGRGELGG